MTEGKATEFLQGAAKVHYNLTPAALVEAAVRNNEGELTDKGALRVVTGKYTGRSPHDKFFVDVPEIHDDIAWGSNKPISEAVFDRLYAKAEAYAKARDVFVFDGFAGADEAHRLHVRFINEYAWQNLFVHQLFIRPEAGEKLDAPDFTVICMPGLKAVPEADKTNSEAFILVHLTRKIILIGGTSYAGEMKKSIFTVMNYVLPKQGIMSMHCSANVGANGDAALFFGLSGTGKTTLSADPNRSLVGDDEHGWSEHGIFNVEGGCYAKCIHLSLETEPEIFNAVRFGTVLENVYLDDRRTPDYDSAELTENTRAAYPLQYIPNALAKSVAGHPQTVVFLTADAFGVLPPISKLTKEQAMYQFLSGYTSKLAGTERGITEPQATFSTCFGQPFLPLSPLVYANLLGKKLEEHHTRVYLINTGWTGGPYGVGKRMKLAYTRAMLTAALEGALDKAEWKLDPVFNVYIPQSCPNVPVDILDPRNTWADKAAYDAQALKLARLFKENFAKFEGAIPKEVEEAGPKI